MAGKKISQLTKLTELTGTEIIPVAKDGENYGVESSLLQGAASEVTTRLNDFIVSVDKFMPALSVKDLFTKITDFSLEGVYQANGTFKAIPGGLNISTPIIDVVPNTVYRLKSLATALDCYFCLYDTDGKLIASFLNNLRQIEGDYVFAGVSKIAFSVRKSEINNLNIGYYSISNPEVQANRALYVAAGAVYNEKTGFYELNGLTDITEEQMRSIYIQTHGAQRMHDRSNVLEGATTIRTNLPFRNNFGIGLDGKFRCTFLQCSSLEVACVTSSVVYAANVAYMFESCLKLKKVIGILDVRNITDSIYVTRIFLGCELLEDVRIANLKVNISFAQSPLLSLESLQYLINNAANTSAITVTVHADVYAKIQDESNTDWHALLALAQEKQITFATA